MKYLLLVLLASAAFAAESVEDEIVNAESDVQSAQYMMGRPFMTPMMNRKSYSSGCVQACPCVQRCMVVWWVPCPCWCPPPCDDGGDGNTPPTQPPTEPPTPPPTEPPAQPTNPPNDCNTCSCVWVPCTVWWMCRPRCPSSCCVQQQPCCQPCKPCTSWPCQPCNPCNNPCKTEENQIEMEIEKQPERVLPDLDLDEWRDRLREGLNVILARREPEPQWWDEPEQPRGPPRPPVRRFEKE